MTEHGFLDSARRDEFKDIQHAYICPNHYRDLGWSDEFSGIGGHGCVKKSYRKIRNLFITFDRNEMKRCKRVKDSPRGDLSFELDPPS